MAGRHLLQQGSNPLGPNELGQARASKVRLGLQRGSTGSTLTLVSGGDQHDER